MQNREFTKNLLATSISSFPSQKSRFNSQKATCPSLPQEVIEDLIDGILIITEQKEVIYANDTARRVLRELNQEKLRVDLIPKEIWHICQALIQTRSLFPSQHWLIESEIITSNSTTLHIRVRWLKIDSIEKNCILINLEDPYQAIKNLAVEEAQRYGITRREKEVWLLHRAHYTYKQIALELCITPNTVKKHMKNIYAKQKDLCDSDE
jgi:DNA-binding CsgD family transcriptional regulator